MAGVDQDRIGLLDRLGMGLGLPDVEVRRFRIERLLLGPQALDDGQPLGAVAVAIVVRPLRAVEHLHLRREPAHHQVEGEAAVGDMVDGRGLLGGNDGMHRRHVRGRGDHDVPGRLREARRPGVGLERLAVEVGRAAEAAPARHRQGQLESHGVGTLDDLGGVLPGHLVGGGRVADVEPVAAIDAEHAELELLVVVQRHVRAAYSSRAIASAFVILHLWFCGHLGAKMVRVPRNLSEDGDERANHQSGQVRCAEEIRAGQHTTVTTGLAAGHLQANLGDPAAGWAEEFAAFCAANPKPCPLIARSEPGDPTLPTLGDNIDVRRDLPRYRVFRDGVAVSGRERHQRVVAGRSGGLRPRLFLFVRGGAARFRRPDPPHRAGQEGLHLSHRLDTVPAGRLHGRMVVSMRNFPVPNAIRAIEIASRFPQVHGAPIHFGDPARSASPISTGPSSVASRTSGPARCRCSGPAGSRRAVIEAARPPFCITHKAGHMLVTDRLNEEFRDA